MCLIVSKPVGIEWDYTALINGFSFNPDGIGFMYPTSAGIRIKRGLTDIEELLVILDDAPLIDKPVIVHFRWATHGTLGVANCHPFPISSKITAEHSLLTDIGIAHNGIIPGMDTKSRKSDTVQFIEGYLNPIRDRIFSRSGIRLLNKTQSKYALMNQTRVRLVGKFVKDSGIWYSNDSYLYSSFMENNPIGHWLDCSIYDDEECTCCAVDESLALEW